MDRKKGTSSPYASDSRDPPVVVTYRELAPAPELRAHVRTFFSFTPGARPWPGRRAVVREVRFASGEPFCSPVFADARASLVVELGSICRFGEGWSHGTPVRAYGIGALRAVGSTGDTARAEMIGAYLEPGATWPLLGTPAVELTDRIVDLSLLWESGSARLAEDLAELPEAARVDRLEAALAARLRRAREPGPRLDVTGLACWARNEPARMTVRRLADAAGVSRQHLTRVFREVVGVSPKRYCRLVRFQAGLAYAGAGAGVPWARVAGELGYADQSHMIAEFRELSSLTPEKLATERWFHPFILEGQDSSLHAG
jgi:AraC-like DNA-binding protein